MKQKKKYLFLAWLIILLAIVAVFYLPNAIKEQVTYQVSQIEKWVYPDGSEITLPESFYEDGKKTTEIYTILSEDFNSLQTLGFWTYFQDVKVYLEEKLIYETNDIRYGKAIPSQWNYVEVPGESAGKRLRICLETPYDEQEYCLLNVVYGTNENINKWIQKTYGISLLVDITMLITGLVFVIVSFIRNTEYRYKICYFSLGAMIMLFGGWLRTSLIGVPLYWMNSYVATLLGHLCFLMLPVFLALYLKMRVLRIELFAKVCDVMLVVQYIEVIALVLLQALGIRDIQENILIAQCVLILTTSWAIVTGMYYFIKRRARISIMTVINSFLLIISLISIQVKPIVEHRVIQYDVIVRVCVLLIVVLEMTMFLLYLKKKEEAQKRIEKDHKNMQLQILTGQIKPHFILNTIGAIRNLIRQDPEKASDLLYDFSKYIRKNMEQKDYSKAIPFMEELDYIETYLNLERLRFDDKVNVEFDIQEKAFWILPLTIQPFVENAVKHGVLEKKQGGTIKIITRKAADCIVIEIKDDGVGFDVSDFWINLETRKSVGMKSAILRLKNEMNAVCEVKSSMTPGMSGTFIKISIPEKGVFKYENNNRR